MFVKPSCVLPIAFLIAACSSPDAKVWEEEDIGPVKSLSGVWGSGPDDVFIAGGSDEQGEMYHYDGDSWSLMQLPTSSGLLNWSFGFGPNDVWTVGKSGRVLHYDGSEWTAIDSKTDQDLWGVWGASSSDVYMVGGNVFSGQIVILHWDGTSIEEEELPAEHNPLGVRALFKVFGVDGKIFAVGQTGLIIERTAAGWVRHPAGPEADEDFVALWGTSADDIVAVGGRTAARISTWDGTSWTTIVPEDNRGGLNAVFVTADNEVLVGGHFGSIGIFDRATGVIEYEPTSTQIAVHAIWADDQGTAYAVGGTFFAPHAGFVMIK